MHIVDVSSLGCLIYLFLWCLKLFRTVFKSPCIVFSHGKQYRSFFKVCLYRLIQHVSGSKFNGEFRKTVKNAKWRLFLEIYLLLVSRLQIMTVSKLYIEGFPPFLELWLIVYADFVCYDSAKWYKQFFTYLSPNYFCLQIQKCFFLLFSRCCYNSCCSNCPFHFNSL